MSFSLFFFTEKHNSALQGQYVSVHTLKWKCMYMLCIKTQSAVLYLYRELMFRRRAQSADDDTSAELPDSLQHLTLSEFLKEYVNTETPSY